MDREGSNVAVAIDKAFSSADNLDLARLRKEYLDNPNLQTSNPYKVILSLSFGPLNLQNPKVKNEI